MAHAPDLLVVISRVVTRVQNKKRGGGSRGERRYLSLGIASEWLVVVGREKNS